MNKAINQQAPATAAKSIFIQASPEKIWQIFSNINAWPSWLKPVKSATLRGPLQAGSGFDWKSGGFGIHSVLHTVTPAAEIGWSGKSMGAVAIHNCRLTAEGSGTRVAMEESMDGWIVKLFSKSFHKMLDSGMTEWLNYLKMAAEE